MQVWLPYWASHHFHQVIFVQWKVLTNLSMKKTYKKKRKEKKNKNITFLIAFFFFSSYANLANIVVLTKKCNVYSFGMVELEILMGTHLGELLTTLLPSSSSWNMMLNEILDQCLPPSNRIVVRDIFLCYNYSICMLMHQTKVPANNELGVPIISFLQETNSQALTCSFTIAVEEPRKLFAWRYWNSIMKCLLLTLVWNSLMNIYEKKMLCTKINCKKSCNSARYICSSWQFVACIFHHQI